MRTLAIAAALSLTALAWGKEPGQIMRQLDGTYSVTNYTDQGKPFSPEELRAFRSVTFDGNTMVWVIGENKVTSTMTIEGAAAGPVAVNLTADAGFMKGKTYQCLMELRNGGVVLTMPVLPGVARPTAMDSTLESRTATMVLKKVAK